jgi:hypothetical protein
MATLEQYGIPNIGQAIGYLISTGVPEEYARYTISRALQTNDEAFLKPIGETLQKVAAEKAQRESAISSIKDQLLGQWQQLGVPSIGGGLSIDDRAQGLAERLYANQITDLTKLGLGSVTSEDQSPSSYLSYDGRQIGFLGNIGDGGNNWDPSGYLQPGGLASWSALGEGAVGYTAQQAPNGQVYFIPSWGDTGGLGSLAPIIGIGASLLAPGLGSALAAGLGTSAAVGSTLAGGLIGGTLAEASGGDFLQGALTGGLGAAAAPLAGGISEAVGGGTLGNVIGQSTTSAGTAALTGGDVEQAALMGALTGAAKPIDVGINTPLTPAQIEAGLGTEGYGYSTAAAESGLFNPAVIGSGANTQTSYPIDMAELAAADAIQLAQQTGNNPAAMEQNLVASGIDPLIAADLSQQVVLNPTATSMDLANNLIQTYGSDIYDKSIEQINTEKEAAIQPEVSAVTPQTEIPWDKIGKLVAGMLTGGAAMAAANQPAPAPVAATPAYQPLTGMPAYSPEYFQSVQQYYNSYMPNMPQDVVTPLSDWYSSGYNEPDSVTASLFNIPLK